MTANCALCDAPINIINDEHEMKEFVRYGQLEVEYYCKDCKGEMDEGDKQMTLIEKKCWPEYFEKILSGEKKSEVRLANFECNPDDMLLLREWNPETQQYTGRTIRTIVTNVVKTKDFPFWSESDIEQYGYQIISFVGSKEQ